MKEDVAATSTSQLLLVNVSLLIELNVKAAVNSFSRNGKLIFFLKPVLFSA